MQEGVLERGWVAWTQAVSSFKRESGKGCQGSLKERAGLSMNVYCKGKRSWSGLSTLAEEPHTAVCLPTTEAENLRVSPCTGWVLPLWLSSSAEGLENPQAAAEDPATSGEAFPHFSSSSWKHLYKLTQRSVCLSRLQTQSC